MLDKLQQWLGVWVGCKWHWKGRNDVGGLYFFFLPLLTINYYQRHYGYIAIGWLTFSLLIEFMFERPTEGTDTLPF